MAQPEPCEPRSITWEGSLFDNPKNREKESDGLTPSDIVADDGDNTGEWRPVDVDEWMRWGRRYRYMIEDIGPAGEVE